MNALNWDVPIFGGLGHSILQKFYSDGYFGDDGISGFQSSLLKTDLNNYKQKHAMDFIEEQVRLYPGEVNIVCLGKIE